MQQSCTFQCSPWVLFTNTVCRRFATSLALAFFSVSLQAETVLVLLQNGDRVTGELIAETATQLQIKTSYAAVLSLDKSQISQVQSPPEPQNVSTAALTSTVVIPAKTANAKSEQKWKLDVDVSASTRRGKEQSDNLSVNSHWELRDFAWRYSTGIEYDYEIKQNVRKTHKYTVNPGVDYFYNEQIFGRTKLDYSYNYLAADYKNIDVSLGPGFSFFKDRAELRLELMTLVGVKNAHFRGDAFLLALLGHRDSISFRFTSLDYDYQYQPTETSLEWYAKGSILKMLDQPIELLNFKYEWHNELGIRYWLTDKIRVSWSIQHDWSGIDLVLSDGTVLPLDVKDIRQKLSIGASF